MTTPFARPSAGGDQFDPKEFLGALIIVFPKSYNPNDSTKFGPSTSADCDIVVVDRQDPATGGPVYKANARLFGNLANSVRDSIGSQVLGRLGQVPTDKGNPAWVLTDVVDNPQDVALAMPALSAYQAGQFKAAAPAQGAAPTAAPALPQQANYQATMAQDPWAGMNAAPAQTPAPQSAPAAPPAGQYQQPAAVAPPVQGQWPVQNAAPPVGQPQPHYGVQNGVPAPVAQAAPADPLVTFLTSRGMAPDAVANMDPATRQAVGAQLGFQG